MRFVACLMLLMGVAGLYGASSVHDGLGMAAAGAVLLVGVGLYIEGEILYGPRRRP